MAPPLTGRALQGKVSEADQKWDDGRLEYPPDHRKTATTIYLAVDKCKETESAGNREGKKNQLTRQSERMARR